MSKNRVMEAKNAKARKMLCEARKLRRDIGIITNTLLGDPMIMPESAGVELCQKFATSKNERKQSAYDKLLATNKKVVIA